MLIIGLTGSIMTGKSTVAMMLRQMWFSVHDADATVHRLMGPNGAAVAAITACFGADIGDRATGINRNILGNLVFTNPEKKQLLKQSFTRLSVSTKTSL